MKTGFKNPIEVKEKEKQLSKIWSFKAPTYDERSSCYVDAGTSYGVGHKTPVGHKDKVKTKVDTLPFGRVNTLETDEIA